MAVGGAPVKDVLHAARTCDMALDMVDAIQDLTDPSTGLKPKTIFSPSFRLVSLFQLASITIAPCLSPELLR